MTDEERPKLRIASARSEAEIQLEREDELLGHRLIEIEGRMRELAANMLRVIRGAGKPIDLFDHVMGLAHAIDKAPDHTIVGQINAAMEAALLDGLEGGQMDEIHDAISDIEAASLRKIAARLLGQPVQLTAGESDFRHALHRLDQARGAQRNERR